MAYNYIIYSDDVQAALNKIEEIKKSISIQYEMSNYDLEDDGIYSIVDELMTVSLFSTPKFIVIKSCEEIVHASKKALTELYKAMNDLNSENVCVFLFLKSFDSNHEVLQQLKRYASFIQISLKNIAIDEFIKKSFEADGYEIDPKALALFVSYQNNLATVQNSIAELKCYKAEEKKITDQDIRLMVCPPLEDNVYQLIEAVLKKDKKRVFSCLKDLKIQSIQASYLVSMLIQKFQELYNVSILLKGRITQAELAELFHISPGRAYYMMKNAKEIMISTIKSNLDALNELDYNIKSGRIEQGLGLDLYFLR